MRRALVTGATGLVGSHIVDRLLALGWSVRALVRSESPQLAALGVETVRGELLNGDAFSRAASGQDFIFHTAAIITQRGDWNHYRAANVDGTRNAVYAAEQSGARLLHLSSVAVYSNRYRGDSQKTTEATPLGPIPERNFYARSKRESEELVLSAHREGRIWSTAVRPSIIYGPRDRQFVPRMAATLRFGIAPLVGGGHTTMPVVQAANVADGAVLAATNDAAGGRAYNLAHDYDVTVRDFFTLAGEGLERRIHFIRVPMPVARGIFRLGYRVARVLTGGASSVVSPNSFLMISRDNPYDSSLARTELGWSPPVRPEEGVPAAFRWCRDRTREK